MFNNMNSPFKRSNLNLLIELFKDSDRKSLFRMMYELVVLLIKYREIPVHYFSRFLFKKRIINFRDFLPNRLSGNITCFFNDSKEKEVLDNKLYFDLFYRQFNINLPDILMYNDKNMFVVRNKSSEINSAHDFTVLLQDIFEQNSLYDSIIIKKTNASSSGRNIYKLFVNQIKTDHEILNKLFAEVIISEFLFQGTVRQHPDLNRLNSSCLNTMRLDTFIDKDGKIEIISGYLRMSITNSHVDNISSGGCQVGIVLETGKLKKYAFSHLINLGVKELTEHPVTKTIFENLSVPFFHEAKELVLKAASLKPSLRLIGWDVGIAESEPVLIEGNSDYAIAGNDVAYGGYMANPIFRKVLHEINYF